MVLHHNFKSSNPYIKHIRTAFDGYLDESYSGIEYETIKKSTLEGGLRCGLDSFDKSYYKSEFSIADIKRGEYGGLISYIIFLDKPDIVFWAWIYKYDSGEYTLRGFCETAALVDIP